MLPATVAASGHFAVRSPQQQHRGGSRKPAAAAAAAFAVALRPFDENHPTASNKRSSSSGKNFVVKFSLTIAVVWCVLSVQTVLLKDQQDQPPPPVNTSTVAISHNSQRVTTTAAIEANGTSITSGLVSDSSARRFPITKKQNIPEGFDAILKRAAQHMEQCQDLQGDFRGFDSRSVMPFHNDTVASLPSFGIVRAIEDYFGTGTPNNSENWPVCQMPPANECDETQLTVIFMAYNHDRLGVTTKQIRKMLDPAAFLGLVKEIVVVWNGERRIDESPDGVALLGFTKNEHPLRIAYPLKMGFPNDLMNRYHPDVVKPTTKALLYYDDHGPFFSYHAIQAGFELWKRHANAQIGAMARQITYSSRQQEQRLELSGAETAKKAVAVDDKFVSYCTNVDDLVDYQFRFFANYDANMVLPSGSLLHANYLCYLWHPAFAEIRRFVLDHPVHPDDMTVSLVVSQLAGVAPRVYSRRLSPQDKQDSKPSVKKSRRLSEHASKLEAEENDDDFDVPEEPLDLGIVPLSELQKQRSLLFSICWGCGPGMTEMKQYWAELRTEAVNSLARYFGSLNSGSIGWCAKDSEHYNAAKDGRCDPGMAKQGWLPWMNADGTPKDTCP
jgi:hypothetical protein